MENQNMLILDFLMTKTKDKNRITNMKNSFK